MDITSFIQGTPQLVPESWCLSCKICCRFPDTQGVQSPTWSELEARWGQERGGDPSWWEKEARSPSLHPKLTACGSGVRCPAFEPETNRCGIYPVRPLDCRLYPFVLVKDPAGTRVTLGMDLKCPYLQAHQGAPEVTAYAHRLAEYLEGPAAQAYLKLNPRIIGPSWPEFLFMAPLANLTASTHPEPVRPPHPALHPLTEKEIPLLEQALVQKRHLCSSYALAAILGWSDLIRYWWAELQGSFCLFAEQAGGLFMPLPPLGKQDDLKAGEAAWEILSQANGGSGVSRIEGIESSEEPFFKALGYRLEKTEEEYLYRRQDLARLRGDRYRSQRWAVNRFRSRFSYRFRPFEELDLIPCLQLLTRWGIAKQSSSQEEFSKALFRDSLFFHRRLLMNARGLHGVARVLETGGKIIGYTAGAPVSAETFCVFLETADPQVPGAPQVLFQEFCRELTAYEWINGMGDCGLKGLRQAKQQYHPATFASTWLARKPEPGTQ